MVFYSIPNCVFSIPLFNMAQKILANALDHEIEMRYDSWSSGGNIICVIPQLCPTLRPRLLCLGILQARILEWEVIPFSRGSSWQGLKPGLLHCRQVLYHLSHWGSLPLLTNGINIMAENLCINWNILSHCVSSLLFSH